MNKSIALILSIIYCGLIMSCNDDDTKPTEDYTTQLENVANDVILPTYSDLHEQSEVLRTALVLFRQIPTANSLTNARQAWREARIPWEQSEGFLFGPVDQQGIDPAIDSWPVNETDLEAVLSSGTSLTKSYIDGLDGTLKGFHTIEYLLFGLNGNKAVASFTDREYEYLVACSESLSGATHQLFNSWSDTGENYISHILNAGETSSIYPSQKAALEEIVNGMIVIADEVGNGKISDPFSQQDLTLEESRFSANSKQDFADNIRSIRNIYLGLYENANGSGISSIVQTKNAALDAQIKSDITAAIEGIESIEGTFSHAVLYEQTSVQYAQTQVRDLQQTLESQLLPLINSL